MVLSVAYLVAVAFLGWGLSLFSSEKIVAVLPLACCGSSGKRGNALASGLKSFKVFDG